MKMPRRILPLFGIAAVMLLGVSLHAQTPTSSPTPQTTPKAATAANAARLTYGKLTPAQRTELRTAREAAEKDPAVLAALQTQNAAAEVYRKAVKAGALAENPAIAPILDKIHAAAQGTAWEKQEENLQWKRMRELWKQQRAQGNKSDFFDGVDMVHSQDADDLSLQERHTYLKARESAANRAEVQAARKNFQQAKTAYEKAQRAAMIAADPSVASILDQLGY